jgi:hypothetical protein
MWVDKTTREPVPPGRKLDLSKHAPAWIFEEDSKKWPPSAVAYYDLVWIALERSVAGQKP